GKAAEGTAALHDAGARFEHASKWRNSMTSTMPRNGEAFGVRLSFLALFWFRSGLGVKAAEKTAALHDAGERFQHASKWRNSMTSTMPRNGEAFGVRLSFLALFGVCRGLGSKAAEKTAALHDAGARF